MEREAIMDSVRNKMNNYWQEYGTVYEEGITIASTSSDYYTVYPYLDGYTCPNCGRWLPGGEACSCCNITYPHYYYYPSINKTEQAFKILKLLVEEKVIKEPTSFKKFCELIEKLAKVI